MKTFPYIFGRVGGAKISTLKEITINEVYRDVLLLEKKQNNLNKAKKGLINKLHQLIGQIEDSKIQNKLLSFKRAVHNNKSLQKYEHLVFIDTILMGLVKHYQQKEWEFTKLKQDFNKIFNEGLLKTAAEFQTISNRYFLKNGLLFSSNTLSKKVNENNFEFASLNKRNKKLLLSLTKYLTRSVSKTTPFSTFNSIFCLEKTGQNYVPLASKQPSNIQISNLLFYYIEKYLQTDPILRYKLPLKLNSNIHLREDKLTFFINLKNNEYFKRINSSELLNYLKTSYAESSIKFEDLINDLSVKLEENKEKVRKYINTLINEGFFLFNISITCHDQNWCTKLIDFIDSIKVKGEILAFKDLSHLLNELETTTKQLANSMETEEREKIILTAYEQVESYFKKYHPTSDLLEKIESQDLFYEDTAISLEDTLFARNIDTLIEELKNLRNSFALVDYKKSINKRLVKLFKLKYSNITKIPLDLILF